MREDGDLVLYHCTRGLASMAAPTDSECGLPSKESLADTGHVCSFGSLRCGKEAEQMLTFFLSIPIRSLVRAARVFMDG